MILTGETHSTRTNSCLSTTLFTASQTGTSLGKKLHILFQTWKRCNLKRRVINESGVWEFCWTDT